MGFFFLFFSFSPLQAYLDISFATDPKIVFPLLICSHSLIYGAAARPYAAGAFAGPGSSDFPPPPAPVPSPYPAGATGGAPMASVPPPFVAMGPYPYSAAPPPQYPAQPALAQASHPYSQSASRYGSDFSSSTVLHPPPPPPPPSGVPPLNAYPTAPSFNLTQPSAPLLNMDFLSQRDEPPPSYSLLFPESSAEQSNSKQ